jgi:hypothetical protein
MPHRIEALVSEPDFVKSCVVADRELRNRRKAHLTQRRGENGAELGVTSVANEVVCEKILPIGIQQDRVVIDVVLSGSY